ncbi:MAG: class I SAM-dependent methyltransferase [Beijerinckiaceae bacterium]|nr:class I SAM-dependent methyltransferase [Beijerinckiaceae bacterium]
MKTVSSLALGAFFSVSLAVAGGSFAQDGHKQGEGATHRHGGGHHHQSFNDPARWSKSFDDPARDAWQKPDDVIRALAIKPDARIADIGAGTGYFTVRLARVVPQGVVFAIDVERNMVEHIASRAKDEGLTNVSGVVASETAANLPGTIDLALMVNSYHHIDARVAYMRNLARSLNPGARIAIIEARPEANQGPPKHFRFSVSKIDEEMKAAGFMRVARHDFLPRQNLLVYGREKQ